MIKICDCYMEPCKSCGQLLPMHLGDYDTGREEIMAFCDECSRRFLKEKHFECGASNFGVLWQNEKSGFCLIVSLTANAYENRMMNHPNISFVEVLAKGTIKEILEASNEDGEFPKELKSRKYL